LQTNGITHILCLQEKPKREFTNRHYLCVMLADNRSEDISEYISICNEFIHEARLNRRGVLVHCLHGVSLSTAIVMAYIMTITKMTWYNALNVIRSERCYAMPLPNFLKQLEEFQNDRLHMERCRLQYKFAPRQIPINDVEWALRALRSYELLAETNSNLYEKIPDLDKMLEQESELPPSSAASKKPKRSLFYDNEFREKIDVNGGTIVSNNVVLYLPISKKDLGRKGRFVNPIDTFRRRRRHYNEF